MVIYADVLVTVNGWVDFLLLVLLRRITGATAPGWRLALGALVGGGAALVLLLPPLPFWASLVFKVGGAAAMVAVSFPLEGWRPFGKRLLWLLLLSGGMAGLCEGAYYLATPAGIYVGNGVVYYAISPLLLVVVTAGCYCLLWAAGRFLHQKAPPGLRYTVSVTEGGKTVSFPCLYDSGNHLVEPFSGAPVAVVEREALGALGLEERTGPGWRVIPFDSLGGAGLLSAFRPERVSIHIEGRTVPVNGCFVALWEKGFSADYRGLLGKAAMEKAALQREVYSV